MRTLSRLALGAAVAVAVPLAAAIPASPAFAATGIHVSGTRILEGNGNALVMRGTNHAHTWYTSRTGAFADIKSLGANTLRVVLSGGRWTRNTVSDVIAVVSLCKTSKLICMLENHDTTGYGEAGEAYSLAQSVDYWISVKSAFVGQENYVLVNLGNEPFGNTDPSRWTADTKKAITRMRAAGISNALVVDGPNWGQDNNGIMRTNAASVEAADPQKNTIFSVHMYGQYTSASKISSYVNAFKTADLPLIIGEFGMKDNWGDVDEDAILAIGQAQSLGWLSWSWSGNSSDVAYLDHCNNFNKNSLTTWGQRIFNGTNGIKATSKQATVYDRPTR